MLYQLSHFRSMTATTDQGGAESQDRTGDTAIFSRVLYQLSYLGPMANQARSRRRWRGYHGLPTPLNRISVGVALLRAVAQRLGRPSLGRILDQGCEPALAGLGLLRGHDPVER